MIYQKITVKLNSNVAKSFRNLFSVFLSHFLLYLTGASLIHTAVNNYSILLTLVCKTYNNHRNQYTINVEPKSHSYTNKILSVQIYFKIQYMSTNCLRFDKFTILKLCLITLQFISNQMSERASVGGELVISLANYFSPSGHMIQL